MKILMLKRAGTSDGLKLPGDVAIVPRSEARRFIKAGQAQLLEEMEGVKRTPFASRNRQSTKWMVR